MACEPSSCLNPIVPEHGSKVGDWKSPLPSGETNQITCADGYTATHRGILKCNHGLLSDPVACEPSSCLNPIVPEHGSKVGDWKSPLPSGETNQITCADGYTATHRGILKCNHGLLSEPVACEPSSCMNVRAPTNGIEVQPWKYTLESGDLNYFKCDPGFTPTSGGKITCQNGIATPVECKKDEPPPSPAPAPAHSASWTSGQARYTVGSKGQNCTEACASAGSVCSNNTQGRSTYGMDIALEAVRQSGLPVRTNDEFQNNFRVRDGYTVDQSWYYSVPGFWITEDQKADVTWKNPNYADMPSNCDSRWGDMMRVCACDP